MIKHIYYSILSLFLLLTFSSTGMAQSYYFGAKLGPSVGFQQWNSIDQDPLFATHIAAFIETYSEDGNPSSLYAQLGYHTRGSAFRVFDILNSINLNQGFRFNNISLQLGGKRVLNPDGNWRPYYILGARLEYTVSTNLEQYERFASAFYPVDRFVNKLNYGVTLGGGFEKDLSSKFNMALELSISPDLSLQYQQGAIPNIENPWTGQLTTLQERSIRNLSLEISLVFRGLREIIYLD